MKHLISTTLLLLTMLLPAHVSAHDFEVDGIYYDINGTEATVTYKGTSYYSNVYSGSVIIPSSVNYSGTTYSVTSIGDHAFFNCRGLASVTIPYTVTSIGGYAFRTCSGLTSVDIPNSVTSIGDYAFFGCSGLTSVDIPNSVTSIGDWAFRDCSGLTSVTIPNSVTSIGDGTFDCCSGLTSVTIPNSVTSIGNNAFSYCSGLTSVTIPNSVTSIGDWAFRDCSGLTSVTIPNSITSIGNSAFEGCSGLNRVDITDIVAWCNISFGSALSNPLYYAHHLYLNGTEVTNLTILNSVTSIGNYAFYYCSGLTSVTIPNSVTSIGNNAFYCCSGLTSVTIPNSVTSIGNNAFYCCSGLTSLSIPNSVASIGDVAFSGCSGLVRITIPNSVTSIGYGAFSECDGLISLTVESGNPKYDSRNNCNAIIETSTNTLIAGCTNTTIPNSVTSIGNYAFYCCSALTSVTIPNSVTSIGECAFVGCTSLTSIDIPNSVTSIGKGAFASCNSITSVSIGNSVTSIGGEAFTCCSSLTSVSIGNSVTEIGYEAFSDCISLTSVTIPNTVTCIGSSAFRDCTALETLNFNAESCADFDILDMEENLGLVFPGNISTINIGDRVQRIPGHFADGLKKLTNVTIPNSVTEISYEAFYDCRNLTSVIIGNSVTSIGLSAFSGCRSLASITIPNSVTTIDQGAFSGCGLTSVAIPKSVTTIVDWAFFDCIGLNDVYTFITDPTQIAMGHEVFFIYSDDFASRTLHVPAGSLAAYQVDHRWSDYFGTIVEMGPMVATSIELDRSAVLMEPGKILQLTAELQPIEAIYNEVLWGSSNPAVATVSSDGLVTALAPGSATITAMTTDGSNLSASCVVTVYIEKRGDVDGNGSVNISDVTSLIDYLLNGDASAIVLTNADCDANEAVNISDVTLLIDYLLTGHWQEEPEPTPEVTSFTVNGVTFKMVTVDGDSFTMGATDEQGSDFNANERPVHQVTLSDYKIGQTEVTQELWQAVMGSNPSNFTGDLQRPVDKVSWNDCQEFISKLNQLTGKSFRLPSEAEWEFAARGGKLSQGFKYAGSNTVDDVAWYKDNSESMTHPVATKAPNELGLYDMSGNVFEWCQDWFGNYSGDAQTNPMGPTSGSYRSCRGGGWNYNDKYCRVSYRSYHSMTSRYDRIGLRIALDPNEIETPSDDEEFVDLGLPSGILWATKNIGAQSPEDFGEYFDLDLEWCLDWWANRQSSNIANESNLSWNWPTKGDLEELVKECTWEWTMYNNVNGYQVTGPNGNSLFLPAAGCYYYENLDTPVGVGSDCDYWSETISYVPKGGNCAYIACLNADRYEYAVTIDVNFNKQPVRPVLRNYK